LQHTAHRNEASVAHVTTDFAPAFPMPRYQVEIKLLDLWHQSALRFTRLMRMYSDDQQRGLGFWLAVAAQVL